MNTTNATAGRWEVCNGHGEYDVMGETAICRMYQDRAINSPVTPDAKNNACEIVASVNACRDAGIPVAAQEAGAIKALVEALRRIDRIGKPRFRRDQPDLPSILQIVRAALDAITQDAK